MKRMISFIISLILTLTLFVPVQASSVTVTMNAPSSIEAGQQFNITIGVNRTTNISGLTATLNYDSSKLQLVSSTGLNGFAATVGSSIVLDTASPVSGTINLVQLAFKATNTFAIGQSTTVSLSNVQGFVNDVEVSGTSISKTISMSAPKSTNNFLSSLTLNQGAISFNKSTNNYTVIVDNNVTTVAINASAEDSKATVSGAGSKNLRVYSNNFPIRVTAENGSVRTYNVNVVRRDEDGNAGALSKNNNLSSLSVEGCDLGFDKSILRYECEVENLTDKVEVEATPEDVKSTVDIIKIEPLRVGLNEIKIIVTSESDEEKEYVVVINRSGSAPTVKMENLEDALKTLASDEIAVLNTGKIDKDILELVKDAGKVLFVKSLDETGKVVYQWKFDGNQLLNTQDVKTTVRFDSETANIIDRTTNFVKGMVVSFEENLTLPAATEVGIYVGNQYEDGISLQVYYFNPLNNQLKLEHSELKVVEGFVWVPLTHTSEYFITPAVVTPNTSAINIWFVSTMALCAILIVLLAFVYISRKRQGDN